MLHDIIAIPAFQDNYIWMIIHRKCRRAVIIDPGDAAVVVDTLKRYQLRLAAVLLTHHHPDHTNGVSALKKYYSVPVYGPDSSKINTIDHQTGNGEIIELPEIALQLRVIATPGHTLDHIVYHNQNWLFCGDTLFSAGCGKLFEGNAATLYASLNKLTKLPPTIAVYCAHEYTVANLKFSLTVEPDNTYARSYFEQMLKKRRNDIPTIPSTMAIEQRINPFLRCTQSSVHAAAEQHIQKKLHDPAEVFAVLRTWKDGF